jgi:hypothetical protein
MADKTDDLVIGVSTDMSSVQRAIKKLDGDIARAGSQIERRFSSIGKSIDKAMPTAVQDRINKMVGVQVAGAKEWTGALADQGKEMERLRARFNPMFSTITRYKTAVGEIRAAHRLGAISSDEMAAAMQRERQAALQSIAAIKGRNAALADTPNIRGGASFNTSNLAAQGFDVAATAAFMPWYTVALQQGPQVAQVFNDIRASGQAIGPAVAGAFLQIINPISLATIATIGLTAAAVQYFTSAEEESAEAKKALQEQEALIQRVAQAWGDVLPAIRAVAAERERLAGREDIETTTQQEIARVFKDIGQEVTSAGDQVQDLMDALRNMAPPEQLVAWQSALRTVTASAAENKTTVEEMRAAQQAALDLFASTGIPVFKETADAIELMIPRLQEARAEIAGLAEAQTTANAINDLQAAINNISSSKARGELDDLLKKAREGEISVADLLAELARISGYAPDVSGIIGAFRAVAEAADAARKASAGFTGKESQGGRTRYGGSGYMQLPENAPTPDRRVDPYFQDWRTKGGGGGVKAPKRTADDRFFEDIEAIRQRTIALAEEHAQLGLSYEAQVRRQTAFDLEQKALRDVREEARRKGEQDWQNAELTPEQIQKIDEVSAAYARQAEELRKAQNELSFQKDLLRSALGDLKSALEDGKLEWEELGQVAINVLDKITDKLLNDVVDAIFQVGKAGSGGGGFFSFLGSLFGGGGGGFFPSAPGVGLYATGTANTGGQRGQPMGIVHGQEAVIPLPNGGRVPVQIQAPVAPSFDRGKSASSIAVDVGVSVDNDGNLQAYVRNVSQQTATAVTQAGLQQYDRNVAPLTVKRVVNNPRQVG